MRIVFGAVVAFVALLVFVLFLLLLPVSLVVFRLVILEMMVIIMNACIGLIMRWSLLWVIVPMVRYQSACSLSISCGLCFL